MKQCKAFDCAARLSARDCCRRLGRRNNSDNIGIAFVSSEPTPKIYIFALSVLQFGA